MNICIQQNLKKHPLLLLFCDNTFSFSLSRLVFFSVNVYFYVLVMYNVRKGVYLLINLHNYLKNKKVRYFIPDFGEGSKFAVLKTTIN